MNSDSKEFAEQTTRQLAESISTLKIQAATQKGEGALTDSQVPGLKDVTLEHRLEVNTTEINTNSTLCPGHSCSHL